MDSAMEFDDPARTRGIVIFASPSSPRASNPEVGRNRADIDIIPRNQRRGEDGLADLIGPEQPDRRDTPRPRAPSAENPRSWPPRPRCNRRPHQFHSQEDPVVSHRRFRRLSNFTWTTSPGLTAKPVTLNFMESLAVSATSLVAVCAQRVPAAAAASRTPSRNREALGATFKGRSGPRARAGASGYSCARARPIR